MEGKLGLQKSWPSPAYISAVCALFLGDLLIHQLVTKHWS